MRMHPASPSQCPEMYIITNFGRMIKTLFFVKKLSRAQRQGLHFWQTKSNAVVVNDHEPSQSGEQILFERMPTPTLAPKIILESRWRIGQEQ